MTSSYTFISYSRRQLYFAEALTLHLQKKDIECWFDLQQLEAGTDWAKDLADGYGNCDRLILVASRASLASPYVAVEWETALKNGREVILAVFEEVEIPEKLKGAATFDFRGNFNAKLRQLLTYLNGGPARHDLVPLPNRMEIPGRMPADIWLTLVNMLLPALWIVVTPLVSWAWLSSQSGGRAAALYIFALIAAIGYVYFLVLPFLRRAQHYDRLRGVNVFVFYAQLILAAVNVLVWSHFSVLPALNYFAAATALVSTYVYVVLVNYSGALLRWFAAGSVPQKMRRRIHGRLLKDKRKEAGLDENARLPIPVKFFIHHDPADCPEVKKIARILKKCGHQEVVEAEATRQILLVTNHTSRKLAEEISTKYGGDAIYILGSTIDLSDSLSKAGQFQWVDFRDNDRKGIEMLGRSLNDLKAWQRESALEATPRKFQEFHAPNMVQLLRFMGIGQAGNLLANGLILFVMFGPNALQYLLLYAVLGAVMYWMVERMLFRRINILIYEGMVVLLSILPGLLSNSGANFSMLLIMAVAYPSSSAWFTARARRDPDEIGMDADRKIRRGSRIFLGIYTLIIIIWAIVGQVAKR